MQSEVFETDKSLINNSNVVQDKDAGLLAQPENVVPKENLIENDEDLENNFSDSDDGDQYLNSFSSPSNSGDDELRWYAYRGRLGINFMEQNDAPNSQLIYPLQNENHQANNHNIQQNQQEEEETDFLEMDFEPDTNSEIENDNEGRFNLNYDLRNGHNNVPENQQQLPSQNHLNFNINQSLNEELVNHNSSVRNTGAKPKQFSSNCRNLKSPKQNPQLASDGDNTFKITGHLYPYPESSSSSKPQQHLNDDDSYNIGASCSRHSLNSERSFHRHNNFESNYIKPHKSPSKSSSHNHKQQRLHEEQNDQFLFEIEPIKPRNSVTIYTSNCDEKILMDALTSLKLKPDREVILNYFNKSKMVPQLGLIDYIIYRSKKNCNYLKIIELIENSCVNDYHDEYGTKKFDINFYPLDFFSTTPEMIDIEVSEIVKRWNPQTDLSPLVNIKNKYFIQTNVLGKLVYIIRRLNNNQKPPSIIFREDETIKIPQFYVSGYITITTRHPT
ncbi:unnamed protein product [Chironomus riparius]|uniref:Uncharacterized protein n=1 Tax=Chironomus riparius TaxID=315576 RepID=A0A9N9RU33_9DIPT|nr:unnamed protein product [Chironomus riparius]